MDKPYFIFDNNTISFYGEFQATGNDVFLDSINHLLKDLKNTKKEKITVIFKNTYLKDEVFSVLIFHLLSEITDQNIYLQVLWYYNSEDSLEVGQELRDVFGCDFEFFENI